MANDQKVLKRRYDAGTETNCEYRRTYPLIPDKRVKYKGFIHIIHRFSTAPQTKRRTATAVPLPV